MVENQVNTEIALRCKPLDPNDPTLLSCQILPKSGSPEKGTASEASPNTQQPDQSGPDPSKASSDNPSDGEHGKYETVNVRRVQIDGQDFFKVLDPIGDPNPGAEEIPVVKQGLSNLKGVKERFRRLKKCNDPRCSVTRSSAENHDTPIKRDTTVEEEGKSCTLPGRRTPARASPIDQKDEGP
jgi:hypothetical protein